PSWPGAGNQEHPRHSDGNTLGCVVDDNVKYSQHFFALRLTKDDLTQLLQALQNASVGTDPNELQVVNNGGPTDIRNVVGQLGEIAGSARAPMVPLWSGFKLSPNAWGLPVPPWQLVSALLGAVPLRVATWWTSPAIDSTTPASQIDCWSNGLARPGTVE